VALSFDDEDIRMYTNGKRVYSLSNRKFVRGRVLRVFLGGTDDDRNAVYLSRVHVADAATTVAASQSGSTGTSLTNTLNGATLSTVGGGAVPVSTSAPTTTSVATPTNPGVTAGPLPAGTVALTPAQTSATQPATLSSPTNPLTAIIPSAPTTQQQNSALGQTSGATTTVTAPIAGTAGPVSTITGPVASTSKLSGPAEMYLADAATNYGAGGWGVMMAWSPVAGVTSYRISRTETGSGVAGAAVPVIHLSNLLGPPHLYAIDTKVMPYTDYTYWVEGVMVSGVLTNPSPIATIRTVGEPRIANLRAKVSGTTQVVVPGGIGAAAPVSGSNVTWTWDALELGFEYEISYEIVGQPSFFRKTLTTTAALPPVVAPITYGVPQGASVKFCVSAWGAPDPRKMLPSSATCLTTQVP
jgi:hypothetical protein